MLVLPFSPAPLIDTYILLVDARSYTQSLVPVWFADELQLNRKLRCLGKLP